MKNLFSLAVSGLLGLQFLFATYGAEPIVANTNSNSSGSCLVDIMLTTALPCDTQCALSVTAIGTGFDPMVTYQWWNGATTQTLTNVCPDTFLVMAADTSGCVAYDTLVVAIDSIHLSLAITDPSCAGCSDGSIAVTVVGGIQPITMIMNPFVTMPLGGIFDSLPAGVYEVCVSDANGCMQCVTDSLVDSPLSISTADREFSYYPNPVRDRIIIKSSKEISKPAMIYSPDGKFVMLAEPNRNSFDVGRLAAGIYIIELSLADGMVYWRFVKE